MMRFLAICMSLLCALVFLPVCASSLLLHVAGKRLAHAETYKVTLDKQSFYLRSPSILAELMVTTAQAAGGGTSTQLNEGTTGDTEGDSAELTQALAQLKTEDWIPLISAAIPPALLRVQTEGALDQLEAYLHTPEAPASVHISFAELKERLAGTEVEAAYLKLLQGKPARIVGQAEEIIPFSYNPQTVEMPAVRQRFHKAMSEMAAQLPEGMDPLATVVEADASGKTLEAFEYMKHKLAFYEKLAVWSPSAAAFLLLVIALCSARSLKGLFLWWGIPCLLAGAITCLFSFPSASALNWFVSTLILPQLPPQLPTQTIDMCLGLFTAALDLIMGEVLRLGAWVGLCGLVALSLGASLKTPKRRPS